jgi:cytochrome b561
VSAVLQPQSLVLVALVPLIAWRLYRRVRRMVGRQRSVLWRHWTAAILFPVLLALMGAAALHRPLTLLALGGGVLAGVALAQYGLGLTRFEHADDGFFYTPSAHIGIVLSALLAGRILYRLFQTYEGALSDPSAAQRFGSSPLTQLVFGMLAGYYAAYAVGLLRWRRKALAECVPA